MLKLETDPQFTTDLAKKVTEQVLQGMSAKYAVASQWPPMLDYKDIMNFFRCSQTKALQIMNIGDFPKVPNVGNKKVPIWSLINWLETHTDYMDRMYPEYNAI
ncbi:hypothetical protein [Sporolactobacillus terrae]|uniref:hypothetical protein n=1 Tax=Sporolactobacillus terrae TaxID=269673 RepID=UPI00048C9D73|nr:hypothetical protein [Sporolactobacillus terrae]